MLKNAEAPTGAIELGRVLREIRLSRKWSLRDFEIASGGQIKDVVLGSYERGSRSISVSKLTIIAATYSVPMSAFFYNEKKTHTENPPEQIIIDLRKLRMALLIRQTKTVLLLDQFTQGIINLRSDWNGEVLSLRSSDLEILSMMSAPESETLRSFVITKG
jgi:transcriptional regulator with XRE-family HTH domain